MPIAGPPDPHPQVYRVMKAISAPVFRLCIPRFSSVGLDITTYPELQALEAAVPLVHVHCAIAEPSSGRPGPASATQPLWRIALSGALDELDRMCEARPHVRVAKFSADGNKGPLQRVHFPGAASIAIVFAEGSELPSAGDSATFYLDAACTKLVLSLTGPMTADALGRCVVGPQARSGRAAQGSGLLGGELVAGIWKGPRGGWLRTKGGGGVWWAINLVWEMWRFNLATKLPTANPGALSSHPLVRCVHRVSFLVPLLRPNFPPPNVPPPNPTTAGGSI